MSNPKKSGSNFASNQAAQRAVAALRAGDAATAEKICRRALLRDPDAPQLLALLGAALIDAGKPDAAEEPLWRAVRLAPGAAAGHEGLGEASMLQGKLVEALQSLEVARRLEPARLSVLVKKGAVLTQLGQFKDAAETYRDLVNRCPNSVDALTLLADSALRLGLLKEAEAVYMRAAALGPQRAATWVDLGRVQLQRDKIERAEQSIREAIRLEPQRASVHAELGNILIAAGRHDDAIAAFERALELDPHDAEAMVGLAHALSTVGLTERAIATYRRCIELHPGDGAAYWGLASLRTYRFGDAEIQSMRRALAHVRSEPDARPNLQFALATALEGVREFDEAFHFFKLGNDAMRRVLKYDSAIVANTRAELTQIFSRSFLDARAGVGDPSPAPIFIVGLPRSGSTLIEQILASHTLVEGTHELPELNRMVREMTREHDGVRYPRALLDAAPTTFRDLGAEYLERTRLVRTHAQHFTDKMSNNFQHVGLISLILPNARIINARRHPLDSCMSSYKMLFSRGQHFSYDLRELGEYYLQYQRLMDYWGEVLPGLVLDVDYEQLVADFEVQVRRILDFCALPWEPQCLEFHRNERAVRTASSEQVRRPLYSTGVHRWRDYESHIGTLIEVLEPVLMRLPDESRPGSLRARGA